jgi:hypothetical protein
LYAKEFQLKEKIMLKIKRKGFVHLALGLLLIGVMLLSATPVFADSNRIYVYPATQTVDPGDSFTISINVGMATMNRGAQCDIYFDPALVQVDSVTEGYYYSDWVASDGAFTFYMAPTIDNVNGVIDNASVAVIGGNNPTSGPTGSGVVFDINLTAKTGVNGASAITLVNAKVVDAEGINLLGTTENGQVIVGQALPGPDLVVSEKHEEWIEESEGTYNVVYTITNQGDEAAAASTTQVDIDSTATTYACPALASAASDTQTVGPFTLSDGEDVITVTADIDNAVTESNEANNVKQNTLSPSVTTIQGNILGVIILKVPASFLDWELEIGENEEEGTLNVKSNTEWQVTVSDEDIATAGHMTEWDGSPYGATFLTDALIVESDDYTVVLDASGVIAAGDTSGQSGDDGEDVDLTFKQNVYFSDPVLPEGSAYRIVITFIGSITF